MLEKTESLEYAVQSGCVLRLGTDEHGPYTYLIELPSDKGWATELIMLAWDHHLSEESIQAVRSRKWQLRGNHEV